MIDTLNPFIVQIVTLKGPTVVVVFLIMLGYALKLTPGFPNKFIPHVNFVVGAALAPILVGWPQPGDMDFNLRFPEIASWFTSTITGFLLACVAWIAHRKVLRKLIDDKSATLSPDRESTKTEEKETRMEGGKLEETSKTTEVVEENKGE